MSTLAAAGHWLLDHWYVPLTVLAAVLGWIIFRKRPPVAEIAHELRAIRAGAEARELRATLGAEQAKAEVVRIYAAEVARLNAAQQDQATALAEDPVALAKFLVRAGG